MVHHRRRRSSGGGGRRSTAVLSAADDPGYMSRKIRKFRADKFDTRKRNKRKFWLV